MEHRTLKAKSFNRPYSGSSGPSPDAKFFYKQLALEAQKSMHRITKVEENQEPAKNLTVSKARNHSKSAHQSVKHFKSNSKIENQDYSSIQSKNQICQPFADQSNNSFNFVQKQLLKKLKNQNMSSFGSQKSQRPPISSQQLSTQRSETQDKPSAKAHNLPKPTKVMRNVNPQDLAGEQLRSREMVQSFSSSQINHQFYNSTSEAFRSERSLPSPKFSNSIKDYIDKLAPEKVIEKVALDKNSFQEFERLLQLRDKKVESLIDEYFNPVENKFIQTYYECLFFKKSFTASQPIKFCSQRGIKIDRVLECEVSSLLPRSASEFTLKIGYSYKLFGDSRKYRADYKLDVVKRNKSRLVWIHQDQIGRETYTQPIQQICQGDSIQFAINLSSLQGVVESVEWEPPVVTEIPKHSVLNYDKDWARKRARDNSIKIYCDLNRICEIEDAVEEWYEEAYYQRKADKIDLAFLSPFFQIRKIDYAGVDGAIVKAELVAQREGELDAKEVGLKVAVLGEVKLRQQEGLVNEAKRMGYLKDRECEVQLRVGDTLLLYISKSNA